MGLGRDALGPSEAQDLVDGAARREGDDDGRENGQLRRAAPPGAAARGLLLCSAHCSPPPASRSDCLVTAVTRPYMPPNTHAGRAFFDQA
ncbi:hypothetical protein ACFPM0_14520 [Pseudonocardia sulfidoxydans]|uniref:hypothetical protein n=1 Tax=Pseudonocardia sulfidoxydans TaxID=54011 RepID=UPI003606EA04